MRGDRIEELKHVTVALAQSSLELIAYRRLSPLKAPALDAEAIAQRLEQDGEFQKVIRLPEAIQADDEKKPVVSGTLTVSQLQLKSVSLVSAKATSMPPTSPAPASPLSYAPTSTLTNKELDIFPLWKRGERQRYDHRFSNIKLSNVKIGLHQGKSG